LIAPIVIPAFASSAEIDGLVAKIVRDLHARGERVAPEGIAQLRQQIEAASRPPPIEIWPDVTDAEIDALVERIDSENQAAGAGPMTERLRARVAATIAFYARRDPDEDTALQ
jgi:hypothetical protein